MADLDYENQEKAELALTLVGEVKASLAQTHKEMEQVPQMLRPMAEKHFQDNSGHSLEGWANLITKLYSKLEKAKAGNLRFGEFVAEYRQMRSSMLNLAEYCRVVPGLLSGFLDTHRQQEIKRVMAKREQLLRDTLRALDALSVDYKD